MQNPDAIIVGAGPAGPCLRDDDAARRVLVAAVLEKADTVGSAWRRHYDRLHLHTDRRHSGLPGMAMPESYPAYPSRAQMVDYLESYAARFDIRAHLRHHGIPHRARWRAMARGDQRKGHVSAPVVVIATGMADAPYRPAWPGSDNYRGRLIHSSDYRNPQAFVREARAGGRLR